MWHLVWLEFKVTSTLEMHLAYQFSIHIPHLVFRLQQTVDVVEAVEDEADGGRSDLVVAPKVGRGGVSGGVGEDSAVASAAIFPVRRVVRG